jgi:hypothetical protein
MTDVNVSKTEIWHHSEWLPRRVIYTRELVAFANIDEEIMIDSIRLTEIECVRLMERDDREIQIKSSNPEDSYTKTFVIKTLADGHNTGRHYYFLANSTEICSEATRILHRAAKKARFRAVAKSRFARAQFTVRKIYESYLFTHISAALIIAVLARPARHFSFPFLTACTRKHGAKTN